MNTRHKLGYIVVGGLIGVVGMVVRDVGYAVIGATG